MRALIAASQNYYGVDCNLASFFKILAVTVAIISAGYFLFSDVSLQSILMKVGLVAVFLVFVYLSDLVGKDELKYLKKLALSKIFKRRL